MIIGATNTSQDILGARILPGGNLMQNFKDMLAVGNAGSAMYHSAVNAVVTTVLALIVCSIAGYGFEIYHSKGKDVLMSIMMLAMFIPFAATMIPLFQLFADVGMVNSTMAVVMPTVATPFLILLFRQSSRTFPHETLEAARIDGLGELSIFARIYLPMMRPTFAAATVITFMNSWNSFLWPKVILVANEYQTMPMFTSNLTQGYVTNYGVLMLSVLIASIPTMIIFLALQRSFANGITGAIK